MKKNREVLNFIKAFKDLHPKETEDMFLHGLCYWFSDILERQFEGRKCYDCVENHFISQIDGHLYDIRGCVDKEYEKPTDNPEHNESNLIYWDVYQEWEPLDSGRVIKYCKNLKP